jgi:hypothetical protein
MLGRHYFSRQGLVEVLAGSFLSIAGLLFSIFWKEQYAYKIDSVARRRVINDSGLGVRANKQVFGTPEG